MRQLSKNGTIEEYSQKENIASTKILFPMAPQKKMEVRYLENPIQQIFQESSRKTRRTAELLEEQAPGTIKAKTFPEKISTKPVNEDNNIFLILPSYAEKFQKDMPTIITEEKIKLCKQRAMKMYLKMLSSKWHFATVKSSKSYCSDKDIKLKK